MQSIVGHQRLIGAITAEGAAIFVLPAQSEAAAGIGYFFAMLPDDEARIALVASAERFRKSLRAAPMVGVSSFCLSLCPSGTPEQLRQPLETALLEAAAAVRATEFDVTLDTAMRFTARGGQFPFVLCADDHTNASALHLRKAIAAAQARVGLQISGVSSYLPHVVLFEAQLVESIEESITPIQWKAREFVLIRSFFGRSRHEVIGRWPLARHFEPVAYDMLDELASMADLPDIDDEFV